MRKIILFLSLFLACYSYTFSQSIFGIPWNPQKTKVKIESDNIDSSGERNIYSSQRAFNMDKNENVGAVLVSIYGNKSDNNVSIYLRLYIDKVDIPISVETNSKVLIKGNDGNFLECSIFKGDEDRIGKVGSLLNVVYTRYTIFPLIKVDEQIIDTIKKYGILKVRFEVNGNICDIVLKKDNISDFVYNSFNLVNSALSEDKTFYDDF